MTGIPAAVQVFAFFFYMIYKALTGQFAGLFATIIATVYPACKSVVALETKDTDEDDKIWLTYWVLYGYVCVID
eukprot:CAMPEP_0116886148 /NCGR_PEP_ID=MMETSP0463-20121206/19848_1 /TAXON_ID=181622 /ORGANISM="Strombidinopsis sp, Strain SopsisLIS2011" /LENGTH=73 /DNA_ID=CAMNT_0004545979 /DNA_START=127 /DNA_END=348 /DNA_ORIENTATION=-